MDISVKVFQLPNFVELVREPLGEGKICQQNYILSFLNAYFLL